MTPTQSIEPCASAFVPASPLALTMRVSPCVVRPPSSSFAPHPKSHFHTAGARPLRRSPAWSAQQQFSNEPPFTGATTTTGSLNNRSSFDPAATPSATSSSTPSEQDSTAPAAEMSVDDLSERAFKAFSDVSSRPLFYGKIAGYALGGVVTLTVLRAIVSAVDSLPVLPGLLELIGLGYCGWFAWRYVIFKSSREELLEEIEDLLGRTTGRNDE